MGIAKLNGIDITTLAKWKGVDINNIAKWNGVELDLITDTTYDTMLAYATTQGYTLPGTAVQDIQRTLMATLQTEGLIEDHEFLYMYSSDVDSEFTRLNWARFSPDDIIADTGFGTNLGTKHNAITYVSKKGYKGDVSSAYINHNWNVTTHRRRTTHQDVMIWGIMFDVPSKVNGWSILGNIANVNVPLEFRAAATDVSFNTRVYSGSLVPTVTSYNISDFLFHSIRSDVNTRLFENDTQLYTTSTPVEDTSFNANGQGSFRVSANARANGLAAVGVCRRLTDARATILQDALQTAITAINALP
jgi:hypothetical protein